MRGMSVSRIIKKMGACPSAVKKFKGLPHRKAWKIADFGEKLWFLSSAMRLLDWPIRDEVKDAINKAFSAESGVFCPASELCEGCMSGKRRTMITFEFAEDLIELLVLTGGLKR